MQLLDESQLKARVLTELRASKRISRRSIVANEFTLSKSAVRADLAILDSTFIGIEVKSEKDSLRRLQNQMASYVCHFDLVILAVAAKHAAKALELDLSYVELWIMHADSSVQLARAPLVSCPQKGPHFRNLLTLAEQKRYLDIETSSQAPDHHVAEQPTAEVRAAFTKAFSCRFSETSKQFWSKVRNREIRSADLLELSRFRATREQFARIKDEQDHMWVRWAEQFREISSAAI